MSQTSVKVFLVINGGKLNGHEIELDGETIQIGRDERCQIQLDSDEVSRVHCKISITEREVLLTDEHSSNGTYVNKRRLRGELQLEDGDAIQIGPQLFNVRIESPFAPKDDEELAILDDLTEGPGSTVIHRGPLIDPDQLAASEVSRVNERLKDLKPER
jgi:pSer/pThr/pTyr-binding forkhead associated (FHA) protein